MADAVKVIDGAIAAFDAEPVAVNDDMAYAFHHALSDSSLGTDEVEEIKTGLRAAFANVTAPPAPVVPQEATPDNIEILASTDAPFGATYQWDGYGCTVSTIAWNACRAAMLQAEPVSNSDELPLGYLQGHKDGLEWAAQLAEANHPQTGDWLYDDPIELARAIRKGPDMPESKSVSVDEDDNFYSWFGRFWYENYQKNNYTTSAKQMLGTMAEFAYRAGRESAALASNSPVTPDGWIPVSERMPDKLIPVMVMYADGEMWSAMWSGQFWDDGCTIPDPHAITHWREMPAAPKQEVIGIDLANGKDASVEVVIENGKVISHG
ncbi:DUF551 domain-containing protein [Salmonella sp. NW96]|uniref:DUF551 domain-containing protein n=1 Tax=Salmonella sp. NW96 TaxID=2948444 RepID=UPI003F6849BE